MSNPPTEIDGAKVIEWAWSGEKPFGVVLFQDGTEASEIFGLAICKYESSDVVYMISCDKDWESEQDGDYRSVLEAKESLPDQYKNVPAIWKKYG